MKIKDLKKFLEDYVDEDEVAIEGEDGELYDCSCEDVVVMFEGQRIRNLVIVK